MEFAVRLRRYGFRFAYLGLRIWWFVARPEVLGVKCVITNRGRVLLVRHTYGEPRWDLPGGTIKRRERPLDTARREMAEELGIALDGWAELGTLSGKSDYRRDIMHCFHIELLDPVLTVDAGEIDQAHWFPRNRLPLNVGRYVRRILALTPSAST